MTYARVIPFQCKPGLHQDFLTIYRQSVQPPLLLAQGFQGVLVVSDAQTLAGYMVTLWASHPDLKASVRSSRKALAAVLLPFFTQPPAIKEYAVLVQAGQHVGGTMARVITLPVSDQNIDPALAVYEQSYLPLLTQQPGFQGVLWLANRSQGTGLGISLWASETSLQAADAAGGFFPDVTVACPGIANQVKAARKLSRESVDRPTQPAAQPRVATHK